MTTMPQAARFRLGRAPLVLVLTQVKFSPVLSIGDFVPRMQEALRKGGFPKLLVQETEQIQLGPTFKSSTTKHWFFGNADSTANVVLGVDSIAYEASNYSSFEQFSDTFQVVLGLLADIVSVELSETVGLRYVNYLREVSGMRVNQLVEAKLCGLTAEQLGVRSVINQHAMRAVTDEGRMDIRLVESPTAFLPPDLSESKLSFGSALQPEQGWILDLDHRAEIRGRFEPPGITKQLWSLHDTLERAFLAIVTREARVAWEEKAVSA
jgi:uncharacterized protein (TIGR04255 family)